MLYLTNTESDDLRILPTHRTVSGLKNFEEKTVLEKIAENFVIKSIEDASTIDQIITGKQWAFGLLFKENAYKIRLKPESINKLKWPFPQEVKNLDLTVLHYFIIENVLNIPGREQRTSTFIGFDKSFPNCLKKVLEGEAQMAIITNEISIEDVKKICKSGYTMPQKSTYFYPKVICGFIFSSIKKEEFTSSLQLPL